MDTSSPHDGAPKSLAAKLLGTRFRRGLAICIIVLGVSWPAYRFVTRTESTGLQFLGSDTYSAESQESFDDFYTRIPHDWHNSMRGMGAQHSANTPDSEFYQFTYSPSFHPQVCVSAWSEGQIYRIRVDVLEWDDPAQTFRRWGKTRSLTPGQWNLLRTPFQHPTVIDPLNGQEPYRGFDGSTWTLVSTISGKTRSAELWSPVTVESARRFQSIAPAKPEFADFVTACQLMLKCGKVTVPHIY